MALDKKATSVFWDDNKGPLENLFGLVEVGAISLPHVSMGMKLLIFFSSLADSGLAELGAYLDDTLGLRTLDDLIGKDPRSMSTEVTTDLFNISEEELAKEAFLYSKNIEKFADLDNAFKKEAFLSKRQFQRKLFGMHHGPGFIGAFFNRFFSLFSWAWHMAKAIAMGGLGILALKSTDMIHDDKESHSRHKSRSHPNSLLDFSIKDTPNSYRTKLENKIDDIMGM